jgi:hypothetical protein
MTADPLARLEERTQALRAAAEEVRQATRDAHAAAKDLRSLLREVRELLAEGADELVTEEVGRQLDKLGPATRAAMDDAVARVSAEFDKLAAILMGDGDPSAPPMRELVRLAAERRARRNAAG